ncbi:M20 family metallopeptidase [Mitsuokella sp. AF21-1AC]|uniref:M20 family metallopeptidase n=1 Tax=Mitsuokella sp. AF21-1AC TaxID=2292235 RepID=UPI000E4BBE43|nr:ArgE/DapE family deacylase [Mitsuokella sp. AF21-1AC]RGS72142.1 M20/M25/M40 family metallo-hydrolase [Mitsuokella sp. AF21-1AC]
MTDLMKSIEAHRDDYVEHLVKLVQCDTHDIDHGIGGGLEKNGQEYLRTVFEELGASRIKEDPLTEDVITACREKYHEGNPGHDYKDRYNLYASFPGTGEKSILFDGHVDSMPAGNHDNWLHDPYGGVIEAGKLYGVGACDMKAGLMASIMAVKALQDAGIELPGTVKIASVCDEEGGGNGSLVAAMHGEKADAVVVCEPTDYELIAAHMGWVFFKVETEGIAVHSGLKLKGVNAIDKIIKIIHALEEMEHRWLLTYKHPLLPPPSGNVGVITGGDAGSTVPDYCSIQLCVHYQPGMTYDQVVKEFTDAVMLCADGDAWLREHRPKVSVYQTGNPFEMDLAHPFVKVFRDSFREAIGREVPIVGSPAGCDSRTWRNIAGCPTLQYGPGRLAQCHAVNEYVEIQQYIDAIKIYASLILNWCK